MCKLLYWVALVLNYYGKHYFIMFTLPKTKCIEFMYSLSEMCSNLFQLWNEYNTYIRIPPEVYGLVNMNAMICCKSYITQCYICHCVCLFHSFHSVSLWYESHLEENKFRELPSWIMLRLLLSLRLYLGLMVNIVCWQRQIH